jgi:hypothetical protein
MVIDVRAVWVVLGNAEELSTGSILMDVVAGYVVLFNSVKLTKDCMKRV